MTHDSLTKVFHVWLDKDEKSPFTIISSYKCTILMPMLMYLMTTYSE